MSSFESSGITFSANTGPSLRATSSVLWKKLPAFSNFGSISPYTALSVLMSLTKTTVLNGPTRLDPTTSLPVVRGSTMFSLWSISIV